MVFGLAMWVSSVSAAMFVAFALYILSTCSLGRVLRSRWMYAGLALTILLVLPIVLSDLGDDWGNYGRNAGKLHSIGISPRAGLLYIGDLLICTRETIWMVQNAGGRMYTPYYLPCHWTAGLLYIALAVASLRFWKDRRVILLLIVITAFLIPVTLIDAREPWNEFTWASSTVVAAILLSAAWADRLLSSATGRGAVGAVGIGSLATLLWFLAGPKWGYFCPDWERAYAGKVGSIAYRPIWNPQQFPKHEAAAEIRELTDQALARHPRSALAWYYRGLYASDGVEKAEAFNRALDLYPNHPLVLESHAQDDADAHLRLGILLTERNAIDEARRHVAAAGKLGATIPPEICEKLSLAGEL